MKRWYIFLFGGDYFLHAMSMTRGQYSSPLAFISSDDHRNSTFSLFIQAARKNLLQIFSNHHPYFLQITSQVVLQSKFSLETRQPAEVNLFTFMIFISPCQGKEEFKRSSTSTMSLSFFDHGIVDVLYGSLSKHMKPKAFVAI